VAQGEGPAFKPQYHKKKKPKKKTHWDTIESIDQFLNRQKENIVFSSMNMVPFMPSLMSQQCFLTFSV
jgi:hypothetical protein